MKRKENFNRLFNELDKDFRAEVMAAELIEEGLDPDRILIQMLGALKRPYSKDVASVTDELSDYDHKEFLVIKTPREGIYDMLPEGLFHHPTMHTGGKTEKEIIRAMKLRREEEMHSRKFFLPFEASINFLRMQMAVYENRLDKRSNYDDLVRIFSNSWEIFELLDARQANLFLHLIPILHNLRDNHPVIELVIEMMLEVPVKLTLRRQEAIHPPHPIFSKLGSDRLGNDMTTGNASFDEGVCEILIMIGPLAKEILREFMPEGIKGKILETLCDYLLPVDADQVIQFELLDDDRIMKLHERPGEYNSSLGIDTFI